MRGPGRGGGRWPSLGLDQKGTAPRLLRLPTNARRCVVGQRRKDLSARRRPRTRPFVAARGEKFAFFAIFFLSASPIHATSVLSSSIFSFPVPLHARWKGRREAPIVEPGLVGGTLSTYRGIAGSIEDWGGRRTAACLLVLEFKVKFY